MRSGLARLLVGLAMLVACRDGGTGPDPALEGLAIEFVEPPLVVPGSVLQVEGRSFVGDPWGEPRLRFGGRFIADDGAEREVDFSVPARFVDFEHLEVDVNDAVLSRLGVGSFRGNVRVEISSAVDGETYSSEELFVSLELRDQLAPLLGEVLPGGDRPPSSGMPLLFVNGAVEIAGDNMLLGEGEGQTFARITGCFRRHVSEVCEPVDLEDVPVTVTSGPDRDRGWFAFEPAIAGIESGEFDGLVALVNQMSSGVVLKTEAVPLKVELLEARTLQTEQQTVRFGQYLDVRGGGFLGGAAGGSTLLEMSGSFRPQNSNTVIPIFNLFLVPEFVDGSHLRYVLNEDDVLGDLVTVRKLNGTFVGQLVPIVRYGDIEIRGTSAEVNLELAPVKQVVHVLFRTQYVEALRLFGLRAVDRRIRERVIEVMRRDYATVNLEVRTEKPTDYALYSQVEVAGEDPNGIGLLGYDNTPGKDVGNERLFDRIGGVNALTQEDGFAGYGGVFVKSLFAFSRFPVASVRRIQSADSSFDAIFDPFRPDRGGIPVHAADLANGIPTLDNGEGCPATNGDRAQQIACAVWVLGNLVGTTLSHEVGHSLGLANAHPSEFHNIGDGPNRLMDAGGDRPFAERAELEGQGPARFCSANYQYLRRILPSPEPEDKSPRPGCGRFP